MRWAWPLLALASWLAILGSNASAQDLLARELVPHPVLAPLRPGVSPSDFWRKNSGAWGEDLVSEGLKLRGFEVHETPGCNGIDRIAVRRGPDGAIVEEKFVEVKTHRGGTPKLGRTQVGKQMERQWLADKFRRLRTSSNPEMEKLTLEIARHRRKMGVPIENLGELHELNTRTGRYRIRSPRSMKVLADEPVRALLERVQEAAISPAARRWAGSSLDSLGEIQSTGMADWTGHAGRPSVRGRNVGGGGEGRSVLRGRAVVGRAALASTRRGVRGGLTKAALRRAGPIAAAVALTVDAKELTSHVLAYRRGTIDRRQMHMAVASTGGGAFGSGAGAWAGSQIGAAVGVWFGPLDWITIPVGMFIGGIVGGVMGYIGGSKGATAVVETVYDHLDDGVCEDLNEWMLGASFLDIEEALNGESR